MTKKTLECFVSPIFRSITKFLIEKVLFFYFFEELEGYFFSLMNDGTLDNPI